MYLDIQMSAAKDVEVGPERDLEADVAVADVGHVVLVLCEARGGRVVARVRRLRVQVGRVGVELVADARLPRVVVGGEGRGRRTAYKEGISHFSELQFCDFNSKYLSLEIMFQPNGQANCIRLKFEIHFVALANS